MDYYFFASPAAKGPAWPAGFDYLAQFSADTGLTNQVAGGPDLVPGPNPPVLTAGALGSRAAWVLNGNHPDSFFLTLTNPVATHYLVACTFQADSPSQYGQMLLGAPGARLWQAAVTGASAGGGVDNHYVQSSNAIPAPGLAHYPHVWVGYVDPAGVAKLLTDTGLYTGNAVGPVPAGSQTYQLGTYAGLAGLELTGPLGEVLVAQAPGGFTDTQAMQVRSALAAYRSIPI